MPGSASPKTPIPCHHCGIACSPGSPLLEDKQFCCDGCKMVFTLLNDHGLGGYYSYNESPGVNRRKAIREDKFAFLDEEKIAASLLTFQSDSESHIRFYLPQIHCSSCLYLLENLRRLDRGIISSRIDFAGRQASVAFDPRLTTLRKVADLLTTIGYEPHISLKDLGGRKPETSRKSLYQLGIAGFCFGNIMLLSFPEYLGLSAAETAFRAVFRWMALGFSLPVIGYSAQPFFLSAWKAVRQRFLNIDAPIVLALLVTFARSAYEVVSATGSGYCDSLTGIVFFMLAGRLLQDRTQRRLAFDRDYTAYFPIAATVIGQQGPVSRILPDIRNGDTLLIHSGELIPADGIITKGAAAIDYSFVTGESLPVPKETGEVVYAGGRQSDGAIEVLVIREVAQSYLTQLWEREEFRRNAPADQPNSFINRLSRSFTWIVLGIAVPAGTYWSLHDPARIFSSVTAVLIIACPCALLLSSTFTNGNILRILARNGCYLRHSQVIGRVAAATRIVFDKTGTLTESEPLEPRYEGMPLSDAEKRAVAAVAAQSTHPLSRALARHLKAVCMPQVQGYREVPGHGIEGRSCDFFVRIGARSFVTGQAQTATDPRDNATRIYVGIDGRLTGTFDCANHYRAGIRQWIRRLPAGTRLTVLSGDGDSERARLQELLGPAADLRFNCPPHEKSDHIRALQTHGESVMMIGDGLNDAAALRQSDAGIALSDATCQFTPASDGILEASRLPLLPAFIKLCRANRFIIQSSFALSILYNLTGLYFAVRGELSPMIAAILMPASSMSILLVTYGASNLAARRLRL